MTGTATLDCARVDELAAAYALAAVEPNDDRAISAHLASCSEPHADARELVVAGAALATMLEPIRPPADLRDRLMSTVARTPQDHRVQSAESNRSVMTAPAPAWWRFSPVPSALAAVGLAAAIGLGAWGLTTNSQLGQRDAALRAVASADAIYAASGEAGSGWLIKTGDQALFLADGLAELPSDRLYHSWLIDGEGNAAAAGTWTGSELTLVTLEGSPEGATTFAVTVERERVEQPTGDPVLVAAIDA